MDAKIPLLLPVELLDKLGMVLDMPENSIFWKHTGQNSKINRVETIPHLSIDIFEFPCEGRRCLHDAPTAIKGDLTDPSRVVTRKDFEIKRGTQTNNIAVSCHQQQHDSNTQQHNDAS